MQNPYGAVTEAIKDTRVSLRDIMADTLMNKKMESDLALAKSKAETETAMVNAGINRDTLNNQLNMAHLSETSRHNIAGEDEAVTNTGINQQRANTEETLGNKNVLIAQQNADTNAATGKAHVANLAASTAALARAAAADNEVLTAKQYADRRGAGHLIDMMGIDPNMKLRAFQWAPLGHNIEGLMKTSPAMQVMGTGYELKNQIQDLSRQYNTPGLDPVVKAKIKTDMTAKLDQYQKLDQFIINIKEPDATKIAESARKLWADNPQLATQFKNYDEFSSDFANNLKQTRSAFHDDIANIKKRMETMDISPTYQEDMRFALDLIQQIPNTNKDKNAITAKINDLTAKKDYAALYKFAIPLANTLKTPAAVTAPAPGAGNISDVAEIPSAGAVRLADVAKAVTSGAASVWNNTGGRLSDMISSRAAEQTAAATKEIADLKAQGGLTPQAMETITRKYPYAKIQ